MSSRAEGRCILRLMSCQSVQYGSMERYLVRFSRLATAVGHRVIVAYDKRPTDEQFITDLSDAQAQLVPLEMHRLLDWEFVRDLHGLCREQRVEILHAYFTPACHVALAYARLARLPVAVRTSANMPLSTHASLGPVTEAVRRRVSTRQRILSFLPQRIAVLSKAMEGEFLALGVRSDRIVRIDGGVDATYFTPGNPEGRRRVRALLGIDEGVRVAGVFGRLVSVKGLDTLLAAVPEVSDRVPGWRLLVVGDGPLRNTLEAHARAVGPGTVVFLGQKRDIRDYLAAVDVVVVPSLSEGMSNSLMEALACGKTVIASNIPPNSAIVESGSNGLLFAPGDVAALAEALALALNDKTLSVALGAAGRTTVEDHFTSDRRIRQELCLYDRLLAS